MESKHLINIEKYKLWWFLLSFFLLLPGVIAMIYSCITYDTHAPLKVGIDYTGGTILQYSVDKNISNKDVTLTRTNLEKQGFEKPFIQVINVNYQADKSNSKKIKSILSIRTKFIGEKNTTELNKVTSIVKKDFASSELIQVSSIGPTLGNELLKNSLLALALAGVGIVAYLTLRFQLDFAVVAIISLFHDVIFVFGAFSILGLLCNVQIDGLFVTAVLTVIGFSSHDTIVVFDRIRENLRYYSKKLSFSEIVNLSVNQTLTRSINTSFTTLITLFALYFFGGVTTKDFVLAMILGITIGTYSSIFFASMLIDVWRNYKADKTKKVTAK